MIKNKKALRETEDFIKTFKNVLRVFAEIQEASTLNKSHVMELVKLHKENAFFFDKAFEQAFMKIFKCFHQRANKKIPTKFQAVADMFFKELLKNQSEQSITSFNEFCDLLSQAIFSSIMNVRVMASRIMFLILKSLPNLTSINIFLNQKVQNTVSKSVLFLLKQKVSTYKQLGVKLASLVLYSKSENNASIENQLFKILSTQENQMIRKMVMTNIRLHQGNIDRILIRLRDKNSEIRATLLRRLLTENYRLQNIKLNNLYKLLYDGYGTKDIICKEQALRYFASYFKEGQMDPQNKFQNFIEFFQPNLLLVNSHLYILFNKLIGQLLSYLPSASACQYIMKLSNKAKSVLKDKSVNISNELIWLKNASIFKPQIKEINNAFEEYSPSGTELSQLLKFFLQKKNIFAMNQFLQMFTNIKMPDEIGKNRMYNTLRQTLKKMTFFQLRLNLNEINKNDDICSVQSKQQIHLKKFMLSYYDIPIISNSMDLVHPIISAMKYLRPDSFIQEIQQTISDFQNPDQFPVFKEKSTVQLTLRSLLNNPEQQNIQKYKDKIQILKQKLQKINDQIQFLKYKTVIAVTSISKIHHDWNLEPYIPLIKDEISRHDQSHGIYLLGLYCLQRVQKVNSFFSIFWQNIMDERSTAAPQSEGYQQYKLKLMISLKIMTDFIVKFNILNSQIVMNNTSTDETTDYNSDSFMQKITHLILDKDTDIRIFSIQCLCRMIYHNRVDQNNVSTYFLYLLLLWWQTSTAEVSAKSVHTISLFFRSYIEKGNQQVKKLAQMLCIFHKILKIFQEKNKTINKKLIVYNLKINEFIKKTASIATTVLKYHKQKKTIWTYEEAQLGPQQFFLLYLLYEPGFQNILQKPVNICDFYVKCPLQTLIFVKKKLQGFVQLVQEDQFYPNTYRFDKVVTKKSIQEINRFEKDVQSYISVKNQQTFNEDIIKTLEKIFAESCKYINEEARRIAKNIEDQQIFINVDSDMEDSQDDNEVSSSGEQNSDVQDDDQKSVTDSISQSQQSIKNKIPENMIMVSSRPNKPQPKARIISIGRKKPIIEQAELESENQQIQSDNQSDKIQQIKVKTVQKSRKKAPVERNLSARQPIIKEEGGDSDLPVKRVTRARKPIL